MGKAAPAAAVALPIAGAVAGGAMGGPAGAAAGASLGGAAAGTITSISANGEAEKAQKKALEEELRQARSVAALEDGQLTRSLALADAQAVERLTEQTRQASEAAGQDLAQVERNLDTERVDAAQRATEIRRALLTTLGEQQATMASRNVLSSATGNALDKEARRVSDQDRRTNDLNLATSEADAAGERTKISTSLTNSVRSGMMALAQQRTTAKQTLDNTREATKLDLQNQERAAKLGYKAGKDQTRYANQAALISGFSNLSGIAYDYYSTRKAIEPTPRNTAGSYTAPARLTTGGQASRNGF